LFSHVLAEAEEQCKTFDALIKHHDGLDCILVGLGMNGHIGFNEPGVPFENYCHVVGLDDVTTTVGQKYFDTNMKLSKGVTVGLQHLLEAKTAILIANGTRKAQIMWRLMNEQVSCELPGTIMWQHKNGTILLDTEAAALF
jgi:6-phosphogluconolactonase/glucosamine-6-phosphate isomerase/deaminase